MDLQAQVQHPRFAKLPFHSNPDILDEICEYLSYEDEVDADDIASSRRTLLRLALTCRAFLEPALDRLWRNLDSLFPLLKVLPAFIQTDGTYVRRLAQVNVCGLMYTRFCEGPYQQRSGPALIGTRSKCGNFRTREIRIRSTSRCTSIFALPSCGQHRFCPHCATSTAPPRIRAIF